MPTISVASRATWLSRYQYAPRYPHCDGVGQHAKLVARIFLVSMLVSDPMSILYTWQVWPQDLAHAEIFACVHQAAGANPALVLGRTAAPAAPRASWA